jgi:hypothetical protein
MSGGGEGGWVSVYSVKLPHLQKGDVITADARQVLGIGGLHYAVFDSSQIILTQGRKQVRSGRVAQRSAAPGTALDEANGFNCTQGSSAYRNPCITRKVGQIRIRHDPVNHRGHHVPLYVNLVSRGLLKFVQKRAPAAHLKPGGFLRVDHYRAF